MVMITIIRGKQIRADKGKEMNVTEEKRGMRETCRRMNGMTARVGVVVSWS